MAFLVVLYDILLLVLLVQLVHLLLFLILEFSHDLLDGRIWMFLQQLLSSQTPSLFRIVLELFVLGSLFLQLINLLLLVLLKKLFEVLILCNHLANSHHRLWLE